MKSKKSKSLARFSLARPQDFVTCILGTLVLLLSGKEVQAQQYVPATGWRKLLGAKQWESVPTSPEAKPPLAAPAEPVAAPSVAAPPVAESPVLPKDQVTPSATSKHQISVAADFMLGQGDVTVPIGYSLKDSLATVDPVAASQVPLQAASADRSSIYYGGTISYSYGEEQAWYLDLSYVQGNSSGNVAFPAFDPSLGSGDFKSKFSIDDQWYQAYVRYTFPNLLGDTKFTAYLRGGISYVTADLTVDAIGDGAGRYSQTDSTTDILGNLGFGIRYALYTAKNRRFRVGLSGEGEAFYGFRNQESLERLSETDLDFKTSEIDNTLYGGIGRVTLRMDYLFGKSGAWKAYGEVGAQIRYTLIDYPDVSGSSPSELLWGPYAKIGFRYNF
jgi:hypothetical protein